MLDFHDQTVRDRVLGIGGQRPDGILPMRQGMFRLYPHPSQPPIPTHRWTLHSTGSQKSPDTRHDFT